MIRRVPASPRPPVVRGHATPGGQAARHPKPFPKRLPPTWTADSWYFWDRYAEEWDERQDFNGLYHVTMNLPGVLKTGRLLPRRSLLQRKRLVGGLGGGPLDMAPDEVSVVPQLERAQALAGVLRVVLRAVHGQVPPDEAIGVLAAASNLEEIASEVDGMVEAGYMEEADAEAFEAFQSKYLSAERAVELTTGAAVYGWLQAFDQEHAAWHERVLASYPEPETLPLYRRAPVGITAPWAVFSRARVDDIAVLQLAVRVDAEHDLYKPEMEFRFRPEDVRLLRVVEGGP